MNHGILVKTRRTLKRMLTHACLVGTALVGIGSGAAVAQECDFVDWDAAVCDFDAKRMNKCLENNACERGTVGSLFRWSGAVGESDLPQPEGDQPLVTDRPDFTEATSVVGLGVLQLETGYTYTFDNDGTDQTIGHSYPETLLRYGAIANWLEFRLAANYSDEIVNGLSSSGADDLYLGFKIGLTPQAGWRPETALIPQMTVPTGSSSNSEDEVLAGLNYMYGWGINDFISTAGSTQANKAIDENSGDRYTEIAQSWTVAYSLGDRLGGYTEYFGFYPSGADTAQTEHYFNGGLTYLISNDIQFDIRGGKGLVDAADDYFFGTGLAIRFR